MRAMRSSWSRIGLFTACAAVVLGACSKDDDDSESSATFEIASPATLETTTPTSVFPTVATIAPVTVDTTDIPFTVPATGDIPVVPVGTVDTPVLIEAVVGEDTGEDRIEVVPLGALVSITITDPNDEQEYYLPGYELGEDVTFPAGKPATFAFVADRPGDFELASRVTDDVLLILRVQ
jgi:hypothetical protein